MSLLHLAAPPIMLERTLALILIAHVFYSMAAAQGRAGSLDRLKKVESRMTPVLRDQAHSLRKILS